MENNNIFVTKSGNLKISMGDVFRSLQLEYDNNFYHDFYRIDNVSSYRVVAVFKKHFVVEWEGTGIRFKLYPNLETDLFSCLSPSQFKKKWKYDPYSIEYFRAEER